MFFAAYYLVKKKKGITFASVICHGEANLPPSGMEKKTKNINLTIMLCRKKVLT